MTEEEGVQPEEGQGARAAPYQEYLDRVPEEFRDQIEPVFKEWDANTTRKFQENSEYRSQWEPYREVGVNQHDPAAVEWALQFYNALDNPTAIKEWYENYAAEKGITVAQAERQVAEAGQEELGTFDSYGQPDTQQLEQLLSKQLGPLAEQVSAINQWREQQDFQVRQREAESKLRSELSELKDKHPDVYNEQGIEGFLSKYIESDPQHAVARAFEDWQAVYAQITTKALQDKVDHQRPAETGGGPDGTPEPIKTLADANRIALEQIRASRG